MKLVSLNSVLMCWSPGSVQFSSVQFSCSVCDPMNRSMTGLPVHHQLPEFTQTHVHRVYDAIYLSSNKLLTGTFILVLCSVFQKLETEKLYRLFYEVRIDSNTELKKRKFRGKTLFPFEHSSNKS